MSTYIHTLTGKIGEARDDVIDHPVLGRYLKRVEEGTKALVEGMFRPGTKEEFDELNKNIKLDKVDDSEPVDSVEAEPVVEPEVDPEVEPEVDPNTEVAN